MPKRTEQKFVVSSGKSEVDATNNRRLHSRYCTTKGNYWQTWHITRRHCDSRSTCISRLQHQNNCV